MLDGDEANTESVIENLKSGGIMSSLTAVVCDPTNVNPQHMALCLKALQQLCSKSKSVKKSICQSTLPQALQQILTLDINASPQRETQELIEAIKLGINFENILLSIYIRNQSYF